MKRWPFWLSIYSMICMLGGFVSVIVDAPFCTYILVSFGMLFAILAWYVARRERDAIRRRLVFMSITPSASEEEWREVMNQGMRDIAARFNMSPLVLGKAEITCKMSEDWDALIEELRVP